jgi:hypothetical protein
MVSEADMLADQAYAAKTVVTGRLRRKRQFAE